MTKDEMVWLLRSANCDENTVTVMGNAYEIGFDHGADVAEGVKHLVVEAEALCNAIDSGITPNTVMFWNLFDQLREMQ